MRETPDVLRGKINRVENLLRAHEQHRGAARTGFPAEITTWDVWQVLAECPTCYDTGAVCENHHGIPLEHVPYRCGCAGIGDPCPDCCDPSLAERSGRIEDAFRPGG